MTRSALVHPAVDAESLFASLYAHAADAFWLDSARSAHGTGRWSLMGCLEGPRDLRVTWSARTRRLSTSGPAGAQVLDDVDLWCWLADRLEEHHVPASPDGLPFVGGFVGYLGYGVPGPDRPPRPDDAGLDAELLHVTRFLVVDHAEGSVRAVVTGPAEDAGEQDAWLAAMGERVHRAVPAGPVPLPVRRGAARASVGRADYLDHVVRVGERLRAGDSYEACYTYQVDLEPSGDPFEVYRRLRRSNPAPYAAFLRSGRRAVLSCSPERYLHVDAAGRAETKPIKGTAARVAGAAQDAAAAERLAGDPKARTENLMIVDLLRNDLSRVCAPGTVSVPRLMAVETYATVHQLVSTVRGELLPRRAAAVGAARALFPPGSMTGAPKARTVELLDGLEVRSRGVYAGVLGCFSRCGRADLSVVIRTAVHDGDRVSVGTGGAITLDSDPAAEHEETVLKASAVLRAHGHVHPDEVAVPAAVAAARG